MRHKKKFSMWLDAHQIEALKAISKKSGIPMSVWLLLAVLLLFALVLLALPNKWSRKVVKIAFCIGKRNQ